MKPIRQGDVILMPVPPFVEPNSVELGCPLPHLTLAEGEVTGHRHRISDGEAHLFEQADALYLQVSSPAATLIHEEHRPIAIPQGTWLVRIQREYEPEGWRYVQD